MARPLATLFYQAKNNRVVQNSLYSGIGFAFPFLMMLLFTPSLLQKMGTEGYGLWSVAVSALSMMGVLEFGLGLAISKYIAEYDANDDFLGISTVVTVGVLSNLVVGFLLFIPLYLFANQISVLFESETIPQVQIVNALQIASFGFFPLLLRNVGLAIPEGFQNYKISSTIRTIQGGLVIIAALLVTQWGGTLEQVVLSTVVIMWFTGIASVIAAYFSLRSLPLVLPCLERKYLAKMLSYISYSGLRGVGAQLFTTVDRVAVGAVLGLSSLTYYTICIGIANKFIALSSALTQALVPATSSLYISGDKRKIRSYLLKSTGVLAAINLSAGILAILFADLLLRQWMGIEFAKQAVNLFRTLIFVYMFLSLTTPSAQIANGIGIPWVNTVGALIGGAGTILLIMHWGGQFGLIGTGWANAASWIKIIAFIFVLLKLQSADKIILESGNA
ncbi:MAG: oligosaccharide flippase family protein [Ardenticatenaceae bacterium]|nr:oligosaccharide flippase family protein [Ardenticatenaceae bacterium]MCB8974236.1 oligosaccharide flippase family protein [Ardenticatenaceae bacterium]